MPEELDDFFFVKCSTYVMSSRDIFSDGTSMTTPLTLCNLSFPLAYPRNAASTRNCPLRSCQILVDSRGGAPSQASQVVRHPTQDENALLCSLDVRVDEESRDGLPADDRERLETTVRGELRLKETIIRGCTLLTFGLFLCTPS